jgi:hypothetical protein
VYIVYIVGRVLAKTRIFQMRVVSGPKLDILDNEKRA